MNASGLSSDGTNWLLRLGLRETYWIIDIEWMKHPVRDNQTFNQWIKSTRRG